MTTRRARRRRQEGRAVREGDHRRRLAGGEAAVHAAKIRASSIRPARCELRRHPEADAGDRRRHHRPRDGDGVLDARRAARRRRDARRPDARRRSRPRQGLGEDQRQALRQHHAEDQDRRRRSDAGRHQGQVRRREARRRNRRSTTWCWWPSAAARTARRSAPRRPASIVTDRGFIPVDKQMRTNVPHIFAIGDIVGQPMLAHKAVHEAHVAAEVARRREVVLRRARRSRRSPTPIRKSPGPA